MNEDMNRRMADAMPTLISWGDKNARTAASEWRQMQPHVGPMLRSAGAVLFVIAFVAAAALSNASPGSDS